MKKQICVALCLAAFAWSACNNSNDDNNGPNINNTDKYFILNAANSNRAEIELGQLAVSNATASRDSANTQDTVKQDSVKMYGQMMVDDHTAAMNELQSIANSYGITLSTTIDNQHQQLKERLTSMKGMTFDTAYIRSQIADHQAAISFFESEANHGSVQQVLSYANKYLPKLRMHLQRADSIAKLLNANDTTSTNNPNDSTNTSPQ